MSKRGLKLYIQDILDAIAKIEKYTADFSFAEFLQDEKTVDSILQNLSVIGEAVKNVPDKVKDNYEFSWGHVIGMRNKIAHEYFGVDEEILWETIKFDIPLLKDLVEKIYKEEIKE